MITLANYLRTGGPRQDSICKGLIIFHPIPQISK